MTIFDTIASSPPDPILGLVQEYKADERENKYNLLVGVYRSQECRPLLFSSVKQACQEVEQLRTDKEYLPVLGDAEFCQKLASLIWPDEDVLPTGVQALGGTGSLFLAGRFLIDQGFEEITIAVPTWSNHLRIFDDLGFKLLLFEIFDEKKQVRWDHWLEMAHEQKKKVFLMHASSYNPLGIDMSPEQWEEFAQICENNGHVVIFDMAYHGFGKGMVEDALAPVIWQKRGLPALLCYSCAKNFSLYSERVGALFALGCDLGCEKDQKWLDRMAYLIRPIYSNPPSHGAFVVKHILNSHNLRQAWMEDLSQARSRIEFLRQNFVDQLKDPQWDFVRKQQGLFAYLGLSPRQVKQLKKNYGVYVISGGRINLSALNKENITPITSSILKVLSE